MNPSRPQVLLIDGSGFVFRAFHALPPLTSPQGQPLGAVMGFCSMILRCLEQHKPTHWAVFLDKGRCLFRQGLFPSYKACRPEAPPELTSQFALVKTFCHAFNLPVIQEDHIEADDFIASACQEALVQGYQVLIVSSDKDMGQLVNHWVRLYDPLKKKILGEEEIEQLWGVKPQDIPWIQALAGDSSDGIPGIPGVGPKTAVSWIQEFGSLEGLLEHTHQLKSPKKRELVDTYAQQARICYQLARLRKDLPMKSLMGDQLIHWAYTLPDREVLRNFLSQYHLHTLIQRFEKKGFLEEKACKVLEDIPLHNPQPPLEALGLPSEKKHVQEKMPFVVHKPLPYDASIREQILNTGSVALSILSAPTELTLEEDSRSLFHLPGQNGFSPIGLYWGQNLWSIIENMADLLDLVAREGLKIIVHDSKSWWHNLQRMKPIHSVDIEKCLHRWAKEPWEDVMIMAYIVHGSQEKHDLESLEKKYPFPVDIQALSEDGLLSCLSQAIPLFWIYAQLQEELYGARTFSAYAMLDRPLVPVLSAMEHTGIYVDIPTLQALDQTWAQDMQDTEETIFQHTGGPFLIGSPKQLGAVLFDRLGWPGGKRGKSGAYQTSVDVLEGLSRRGFVLADQLLQWRQLSKLRNTYTKGLIKQVNPKTGRIHTTYSMTSTSTGRLSSLHPNLQNIPIRTQEGRRLREAFRGDPGWGLLSLDYSQIELRLLAHMGKVQALSDAFLSGRDVHKDTASQLFGLTLTEVTDEHRRFAKSINFGIIYGMSAYGLAQQLAIPPHEAKRLIANYFLQYPGIQEYMHTCWEKAREKGYVRTLFGRRCFIPEIHSSHHILRQGAERQAINAPLQGTSADLIKLAMIKVDEWLKERAHPAHLVLQIHDELVLHTPCALQEELGHHLKELMASLLTDIIKIPLKVDSTFSITWGGS